MANIEEANVGIGDHDVVYNILSRLPGKHLLQFRCVSKHWNRLISDPHFMKLRSRLMVLLPFTRPLLLVIDDNVPVHDNIHSVVRIRPPLHPIREHTGVSIVGTFNGIVLLAVRDYTCFDIQLILYNPLTCASKILVAMGPPSQLRYGLYVFGFGYGESTNDLKIVRFEAITHLNQDVFKYDVFDLKTSLWSRPAQYLTRDFIFSGDKVGRFLNGVLYWTVTGSCFRILALNVKEMVFSKTNLPYELKHAWPLILGSIDGCLCMINKIDATRFDLWLSKDQGGIEISWSKARSFTIRLEAHFTNPLYIMGNGKVLIIDISNQLVIYDIYKDSYKRLVDLKSSLYQDYVYNDIRPMEYVETLVSPSDMC